jgi:DNA-binding NarL/FixJ family response regulator
MRVRIPAIHPRFIAIAYASSAAWNGDSRSEPAEGLVGRAETLVVVKGNKDVTDRGFVRARIIVADDHPLFRSALARVLEEASGLEVLAQAADGRQALQFCRRFGPDLVLMDSSMPIMDGVEATRAIKRESPSTIVLMMSAYEEPERLAEAIRAGAGGYLLKTADPRRIIEAVRRALEGGTPVDEELAMGLLWRLSKEGPRSQEERARGPALPDPPTQQRPTPAPLGVLTPRETEVLTLVAKGHANRRIARELGISTSTVKNHVERIRAKLGASDRTRAAIMALEMGLVSGP